MREVDPFTYPDWNERLLATPQGSIFHTTNWLRVLQATYGYRPFYFARFDGKTFAVLVPFMEVKSWFTGTRGVSLPFSDYCDPIVDESTHDATLLDPVMRVARQRQWQFLELRGGDTWLRGVSPYTFFYRHRLALHKNEDDLFAGMRSNYRAKIRKARRHDLEVHILRTPEAMAAYYRLHCLTRQRHGLVPQPAAFFKHVQDYLIAKNFGFVVLVSHRGQAVAGAVFLCFGHRALYKFGASDMRYQQLYPNYVLFWQAMQWLCQHDYQELCFGKSAPSHTGLIQFKDGWGTSRSRLNVYRYDFRAESFVQNVEPATEASYRVFNHMPVPLLKVAGSLLYRHIG